MLFNKNTKLKGFNNCVNYLSLFHKSNIMTLSICPSLLYSVLITLVKVGLVKDRSCRSLLFESYVLSTIWDQSDFRTNEHLLTLYFDIFLVHFIPLLFHFYPTSADFILLNFPFPAIPPHPKMARYCQPGGRKWFSQNISLLQSKCLHERVQPH